MEIKVEPIRHTHVTGKDLYYLKISNGESEILITIAAKTYDKVRALELNKDWEKSINKTKKEVDNNNKKK